MLLRLRLISHAKRTFGAFWGRLADHLADCLADLLTYYEAERGKSKIGVRVSDTAPRQCAQVLEFGGPCRSRTYDQEIKSLLLYQLS